MSISEQISRIQLAKANLRTSINAKGGTLQEDALLGAYSTAVDNLPSGGQELEYVSSYTLDDWGKPVSLTIKSGVTSIPNSAYNGFSTLSSVTLSDTVTSIGNWAFGGCSSLSSITIPNSVTSIGERAFSGCSSLTSITIPSGVTSISPGTFGNCVNLSSVNIPSGVKTIGDYSFQTCQKITSITIPSGVINVGVSAFASCSSLINLIIGETCSLSDAAFRYCGSLSSITSNSKICPSFGGNNTFNGVKASGVLYYPQGSDYSAFIAKLPTGWTSVETRWVDTGGQETCVGYDKCEPMKLQDYIGGQWQDHVPEVISYVATEELSTDCGFDESDYKGIIKYRGVKYLIPNNGLTNLTSSELKHYNSSFVTEVDIFNNVIKIEGSCMASFGSLTSVSIPNSVTTIGGGAFRSCGSISSITIPYSVTNIEGQVFLYCSSLSSITCYATTAPTVGTNVFQGVSQTGVLTIPQGSDYSTWIAALPTGWTVSYIVPKKARLILSDSTVVDIPEDGNSDFGLADIQQYTSTVVEMDIYQSVTGSITIGGCTNLTTLNLPNSITAITSEAFYGCSALTSLTIPDSVTVIGDSAFMECSSLTSLTIPSGVTSIDGWCFMSCSSITDIYCYATTAPTINNQTFKDIATGGTLHYPTGSDYSSWMSNEENYLGYYGWTSVGDI